MNDHRQFKRILLIRRKALGDTLVSMRAVLEVVRAWPDASVDLVIDRPFAPLLEDLAGRTTAENRMRVVSWPLPDGKPWLGFLRSGGYDLVIDWLGSPRTAVWAVLTGAATRVGFDLPRRRWAYNVKVPRNKSGERQLRGFAGEAFLDPLRCLGVEPGPWRDGFAEGNAADPVMDGLGAEYIDWVNGWEGTGAGLVMMMSATWSAKGWPAQHAATLFTELRQRNLNPVIVTGPGDESLEAALRPILPDDSIAPRTNLLELAHLLSRARAFVGTDCGPRHLAASLGVPTVTLFGPTDPVGWNPADPYHVSVRTAVECSPCNLADCPIQGHPCMTELSPAMVLVALEKLLGRRSLEEVLK